MWEYKPLSRERALIGRAPYKFAKVGVGTLSSVSLFNYERTPMYIYIDTNLHVYGHRHA